MAQVDAEGAQSNHFSHNEGISLSYQWNKFNLFGSYRFDRTKEDIKYDVTQINYEKNAEYNEVLSSKYTDISYDHSYYAGINYDFSEKHSIGIQYTGYNSNLETQSNFENDWIKMYENNVLFADNGNALLGKDYSDFLPSPSLSFPIKKLDFSLNFTNRLQRPSFDQLNNKVKYNNQFHQEKGNSNLAP